MHTFSPLCENMTDQKTHINLQEVPESPVSLLMRGMAGVMQEKDAELYHMRQKCSQLEAEAEAKAIEPTSIIADGKQNEFIAFLNVIYEGGYVTNCTKAEFMKRMADAMGAPSMATNYAKALYNIKTTYKYDELFVKLSEIAQIEKKK